MAISNAIIGKGISFQRGDGGTPENFVEIAEVTDIKGGEKVATVDATHFASPGNYKEVKPTLIDPGTVALTLHFLPGDAGQIALKADMRAKILRNFKMVFVSGQIRSFAAYVTDFPLALPVAALATVVVTLTISGAITDA